MWPGRTWMELQGVEKQPLDNTLEGTSRGRPAQAKRGRHPQAAAPRPTTDMGPRILQQYPLRENSTRLRTRLAAITQFLQIGIQPSSEILPLICTFTRPCINVGEHAAIIRVPERTSVISVLRGGVSALAMSALWGLR